jgi:hypothetical protein
METVTIAVVISIVITALFAVMKYGERYYGPNPEKWDQSKFLQLIVVAVVLVIAGYYTQGAITQPEFSVIEQAMAMLGAALFALTGIKLGKNVITPTPADPAVSSTTVISAPPTTGSGSSGWQPDFSVVPAFNKIRSGTPLTLYLDTGANDQGQHACKEVIIDWMDGSPLENIQIVKGAAQPAHTYVYIAGISQYDSHSFYPEFITVDSYDGSRKAFNTEGRSCEIEVVSLLPANPPGK